MTEVTTETTSTAIVPGEKKELDNVCRQLLASDRLRESDLAKAQAYQSQHGGDLLTLLVRLGLASERDVAETISELNDIEMVRTDDLPAKGIELGKISIRFLKQHQLLPITASEDELVVVMANPQDGFAIQALQMAGGKSVSPRVGIPSEIENGLEKLYGGGRSAMGQITDSLGGEGDAD